MNETTKVFEEISEPKTETIAAPLGTVSSAVESVFEVVNEDGIAAKIGKYRWMICALLFFATTINYIDRQVLGILATDEAFKAANSAGTKPNTVLSTRLFRRHMLSACSLSAI